MPGISLNDFLTDKNSEPVFVINNSEYWDESDATSIARQIISALEKFPLTLVPEDLDLTKFKNQTFPDFICSTEIKADPLPSVRVLSKATQLHDYKYLNCKISINSIYAFVKQNLNSENSVQSSIAQIFKKVADAIKRSVKQDKERKQREKEEREKAKREAELKVLRENLERLEKELAKKMSPVPSLPWSLQPGIPPFDENALSDWFKTVKETYAEYEVPEKKLHFYIFNALPPYARTAHAELRDRPWSEYVQEMVKRFQPDNSMSAVLDTIAQMNKKENESYRAFVNRLSGIAKRSDPPLPEKEICRALLKALPVSISSLMIGKGYTTVTEFITIMENILTDMNLIERKGATVENKVLATLGASDDLAEKLEKLEIKLEALTSQNIPEQATRQDRLEDLLTMMVQQNSYRGRGDYNGRRGGGNWRGNRGNYRGNNYGRNGYTTYSNYRQNSRGENSKGKDDNTDKNQAGQNTQSYNPNRGSGRRDGNCYSCGRYGHFSFECRKLSNFRR